LEDQYEAIEDFRQCLVPNSFRITTETRVSMYEIEHILLSTILAMNEKDFNDYQEIHRKVERLVTQTKMSIEILDDDHASAIFVFTVVTLIFLPMSIVTGLLGMNTVDIRNQDTKQWLFWVIALPNTVVVILWALLVAYRLDEMRERIDKKTKKELRK
jgi:Mg2+ and Co2+ transporter CorA